MTRAGVLAVLVSAAAMVAPAAHAAEPAARTVLDASAGLPGALVRSEGDPAPGDVDVDDAYDSMGVWRTFMLDLYGRNSWDGQGAPLEAAVHAPGNNAYWDNERIVLGDGDGVDTSSFARSPDVIYEELMEPVIVHTAGLLVSGESGAVRVAVQDAFAAVGDAYDAVYDGGTQDPWLVGESLILPAPGFLRSLADPTSDGSSIDHYSHYLQQTETHAAAGIVNNAFYLLAQGGTNSTSGIYVEAGIGIFEAGQLWYDALTTYAPYNVSMAGWRAAVLSSANARYGVDSVEAATVQEAFHAVGLSPPAPVVPELVLDAPVTLGNGDAHDFVIHTAPGVTVTVKTSGGTGDADLYVRHDAKATPVTFDVASAGPESAERVTVEGGEVFVHLEASSSGLGQASYAAVTLEAFVTDVSPSLAVPLAPGGTLSNVAGAAGSWRYYAIPVPQGTIDLDVDIGSGSGNATLYLMRGRPPTLTTFGQRSQHPGNAESLTLADPIATTWYVGVYGVTAYSGLHVTATVTAPPTLQPGHTLKGLHGQGLSEHTWAVPVPAGVALDLLLHGGPEASGLPGMVVGIGKVPVVGSVLYGGLDVPAAPVARTVYVTVATHSLEGYDHWRLTASTTGS